jgi:Leucine-rich repeat (LRR) protein
VLFKTSAQHSSSSHVACVGDIPAELCLLANLNALDLSDNSLTGIIPVEIDKLAKLAYLDLSANLLTGD